jgi:hypothetical protein
VYLRITNGQPEKYTIGQLRRDNPNISFPKDIPADILEDFGVYPIKRTAAIEIDSNTQIHTQDVQLVNDEWVQTWSAVQLPQDQAEENIRAHRNNLLQETDYLALSDNTMSAAMSTYRQALRDITNQEGFPYSVTWPTKP